MSDVYSFYNYYFTNTFSGALTKSYFNWGSIVRNNAEGYECNTFSRENALDLFKQIPTNNMINLYSQLTHFNNLDLIDCLLEELNWYSSNKITMHFEFSANNSIRFLIDKTKIIKEIKRNTIIDLGFYYGKDLLTLDSIVNTNINLPVLKKFLKAKRIFVIRKKNLDKLDSIPVFKKMCLSHEASGVIVHEVFGHLFEEDNYLRICKDISINIPYFINVIDSPRLRLCGFCLFDEEGNTSSPIIVIKNGKLENLLSSNYSTYKQNYIQNSRSRLGFGGKEPIPRMTNTILLTDNLQYVPNDKDILFVDSINFAKLNGDKLMFNIDSAEMKLNGQAYRFSNLSAKISVKDFIENIIEVYGKNKSFTTAKNCIKKRQNYVGVGFSVPQIIVHTEKCKSFELSNRIDN